MSLVLTSVGVGMGLLMGRWLSRRATRHAPKADMPKTEDELSRTPGEEPIPWDRFVCRLGDVIVRQDGAEAWLAGAVLLSEDAPAAVLFVAPEAKRDRAVLVRAKPSTDLLWLSPLDSDAWKAAGSDPPPSIEIEGEPYDRVRRLPFRTRRVGEGTPDLGAEIILAEYKSLRSDEKRVISISAGGRVRVWSGERLDASTCDILPSGARAR